MLITLARAQIETRTQAAGNVFHNDVRLMATRPAAILHMAAPMNRITKHPSSGRGAQGPSAGNRRCTSHCARSDHENADPPSGGYTRNTLRHAGKRMEELSRWRRNKTHAQTTRVKKCDFAFAASDAQTKLRVSGPFALETKPCACTRKNHRRWAQRGKRERDGENLLARPEPWGHRPIHKQQRGLAHDAQQRILVNLPKSHPKL